MKKCAAVSYILHVSFTWLVTRNRKADLKFAYYTKVGWPVDRAKKVKQHVQLIHEQWDQIFSNSTCDEHLEELFRII